MPTTPNYGWTTPVVNGDFGAWGGILNAAFVEIDSDIKALADTVAANALNVAKTNVNNTFAGTQTFTNIAATGTITATGTIAGAQVFASTPALPNDTVNQLANFNGGTDGTLGPTYLQIAVNPSATAGNRFARIQAGDNITLRKFGVKASQTYIGLSDPTFVGSEILRVDGSLSVAGITVTGGNIITGSGAGLTAIPQSAVTNLVSDLAGKAALSHSHFIGDVIGLVGALAAKSDVGHTHTQADITNLASDLANKSNVGHVHSAADITSGSLPWTRIANPTLITFDAASTSPFTFVSNQTDTTSGTATTTLNRPSGDAAFTVRGWRWLKVTYPGWTASWIPVWTADNV